LINQIEFEDDKDKSMMASIFQQESTSLVPKEMRQQENMKESMLSKSVIEKCNFVSKIDHIATMYKQNMVQLMNFGFNDFEICFT
jgi:hypothetical protein